MPGDAVASLPPEPLVIEAQTPRRWLKVGVEMEGGWTSRNPAESLPCDDEHQDEDDDSAHDQRYRGGLAFHYDGSVHVEGTHEGEIVTEPCDSLDRLWSLMDRGHPERVNITCGMHVHASFARGDYSRLLDDEFARYFRSSWALTLLRDDCPFSVTDRELFVHRLDGNNRFAQRNCPEDRMEQVRTRGKGGPRYQQLNYCYSHLGTIECRLLPAFETARAAKWAVARLLEMYDAYLHAPDPSECVECSVAPLPSEVFTEDHETEVQLHDVVTDTVECTTDLHPELMKKPKRGTVRLLDVGKSDSVRRRFRAMVERLAREGTDENY